MISKKAEQVRGVCKRNLRTSLFLSTTLTNFLIDNNLHFSIINLQVFNF